MKGANMYMKILLVIFWEKNSFGAIRSFYALDHFYCSIGCGQIEPGHC